MSLSLGRKTTGNLARYLHLFMQTLKKAFHRKSPILKGRHCQLKPGKLLSLTGNIGNKTKQLSILLRLYSGSCNPSNTCLYIESPGIGTVLIGYKVVKAGANEKTPLQKNIDPQCYSL